MATTTILQCGKTYPLYHVSRNMANITRAPLNGAIVTVIPLTPGLLVVDATAPRRVLAASNSGGLLPTAAACIVRGDPTEPASQVPNPNWPLALRTTIPGLQKVRFVTTNLDGSPIEKGDDDTLTVSVEGPLPAELIPSTTDPRPAIGSKPLPD